MKNWDDIIKEILSKKYIANIFVLLVIAIIALIVSGDFFAKDTISKQSTKEEIQNLPLQSTGQFMTEEEFVEYRLKNILERIRGAGEVEVMITFEMGSEVVPALNTVESRDSTEERDASGGTRTITSHSITENIVITNDPQGHRPVVLKEIKPQIKGVIVVAEGADDIAVKAQLYEAVKTVLQIPGHRVQVYPKN